MSTKVGIYYAPPWYVFEDVNRDNGVFVSGTARRKEDPFYPDLEVNNGRMCGDWTAFLPGAVVDGIAKRAVEAAVKAEREACAATADAEAAEWQTLESSGFDAGCEAAAEAIATAIRARR